MPRLSKEESKKRQEYAKKMFLDPNLTITQKEMAERAGITVKTLTDWIEKEGWKKLKINLATSKSQALQDFYQELNELNTLIKDRPEGERFASFKEAQQRRQLIKDIKAFETETSIAEVYEVGTQFLDFLKPINEDLFKQLVPFYDAFLRSKLN